MFFSKWLRFITLLLLCVCIDTPAIAQSLKDQQTTLAKYEKQLKELKIKQQQLNVDLKTSKSKLDSQNNQPSPEKDMLDAAQKELDKATTNYHSNPTSDNKAKKTNAAFKHVLAERKFKKSNSKQFDSQQQYKAQTKELAETNKQINALNLSINKQRKTIDQNKAQLAKQDRILKEQKQRNADNEIRRLKTELAQQKLLQKEAQAKQIAQQKRLQEQKLAQTKPAIKPAQPQPIKTITKNATTKTNTPKTVAVKNQATTILLTTTKQVKKAEDKIKKILKKRKKKRSRYNKILNIKTVQSDGSIGKPEANTLRALGNNRYKAVVKLEGGNAIFSIGFKSWEETVPSTPESTEYVFLYDASKSRKPRLIYYNKSLSTL